MSEKRCRCWDDSNPPPGARCRLCGRIAPGNPPHRCHARGCSIPVKPQMLMCLQHWRMVPQTIQRAVWATYRAGQCDDKPSLEWHDAAAAAIGFVAGAEGHGLVRSEIAALESFGYAADNIRAAT